MDIKSFVKNHKKKIIAVGTVVIISLVSILSGANPISVVQCLTSVDPLSVACTALQAADILSTQNVVNP
jgi:hypothetical protein